MHHIYFIVFTTIRQIIAIFANVMKMKLQYTLPVFKNIIYFISPISPRGSLIMKKTFLVLATLLQLSCRTTGSGTPEESAPWQAADVKENAKKAFISAVQTCVPLMAEAIQAGRGEQVRKLLSRSEVEKYINIMMDYGKKQSDIDPVLEEFYRKDQKPFDCDPAAGSVPNSPMAEYIVLEFINKSGLLRLGYASKGNVLTSPPSP